MLANTGGIIGVGLIGEGVADLVTAFYACMTGNFSWKEYLTNKAISLAISLVVWGAGKVINVAGKAIKSIGSTTSSFLSKMWTKFANTSFYKAASNIVLKAKSFCQPVIDSSVKAYNYVKQASITAYNYIINIYRTCASQVKLAFIKLADYCKIEVVSENIAIENFKRIIKSTALATQFALPQVRLKIM